MDYLNDLIYRLCGTEPDIEISEDDLGAVVSIRVKQNISRVVGKQGKTINALGTITRAIGYNGTHNITLRLDKSD